MAGIALGQSFNGVGQIPEVFGRIYVDLGASDPSPVLKHSRLPVRAIAALADFVPVKRLRHIFPTLRRDDVFAAQAFRIACLPADQQPAGFRLLLDENISYLMLPKLATAFGWCTHVYAFGEYRRDLSPDVKSVSDQRVFEAALKGRMAVISMDNDLRQISRAHLAEQLDTQGNLRPDAQFIPPLIRPRPGLPREKAVHQILSHREVVLDYLGGNHYTYLQFTERGPEERSYWPQSG